MSGTKFVSFIFNDSNHSQRSWVEAYTSLQRDPTQASLFLTNREVSGAFIAGFGVYGMRIADFLQQVPRYTPKTALGMKAKEVLDSKQALGGHLIKKVLIPLLEAEYQHLHTRDALFELLVAAMALSDRGCFDQLAARLGEIPHLLGKLISEKRSSTLIQEWIKFLPTNPRSMQNWTETVVNLAENCDSDHGVSEKTERWGSLKSLRVHLYEAKHQLEASQQSFNPDPMPTSQTNFRVLGADEDYYGETRQPSFYAPPAIVDFAPEVVSLLRIFGMSTPHSEGTLLRTIEGIEINRTLNILDAVMSTFPCRLCFTRGYGKISEVAVPVIQTNFEQRLDELDLGSFEGLLGSDLGIWKISLSAQALKDLKHSKREGNFHRIRDKLVDLASGEWGHKSVARPISDANGRFQVRVFQAEYASNGRIVWQVDVGFDEKYKADCQIVRVWRIGDVKEMLSSLDSVYRAQKAFTPTRIKRCKENVINKSQNRKVPAVFRDSEEDTVEQSHPKTTDERTPQDMLISGKYFHSQDLPIRKFHTLTSTVLDSILHGQSRSDFPFDVTGKEVEIIKHFRTATFILGRSGTGKTSCLLYKLLSRYLARNLVESENPIRQVLLTRSEPLARKLGSEVQLLIDTQLRRVNAEFDYVDGDEIPLHIRDGMDEETTEDLFSLRKQDFPLVCTFGNFLKRLENTIKANDRNYFASSTGKGRSSTANTRQMVDFKIFSAAYWQQFPTNIRAGLEPDLVFTEIMGVIKGAASLVTGLKPLSRGEYRSKSSRLAPTFAKEGDRDRVYDVFEYYEGKKGKNEDYDGIDRVKEILGELARDVSLRRRVEALFEEVYVDEVQDQRPLEIELLLNLVQNPRGIHFAGDSAQCISKDSTFRFANVKALFYEHFSGSSFASLDPALAKPELFSLSRNFRSHQGILSLASFVMELLWKGFPDMVDKLPPEIGQYLGPKPVIFIGSDIIKLVQMAGQSTGYVEGKGESESDSDTKQVKTRQVVIIRDQSIQEDLQEKLGDGSLVFTILQSKGMEYDDIFLFDFFSTSPCLREFKSLQELLYAGTNPSYGINHMNMCSELKNLYVAITRPRSRLWVLESQTSFVVELFTDRVPDPLVNVKPFKSEDLPGLMPEVRPASATSAREWIETGEQCMERGIFDQALRCFKNGQDTQKVLWAEASVAEQKGRECRAKKDIVGLKSYFKEASNYFLEVKMKEKAAYCLEALGDFAVAAGLYSERGKHEKAAGLFERAGMYEKAAEQYLKAGIIHKALQALYSGKLFELLVRRLHSYKGKIDDGDRKTYARECNILLRQGKIPPSLREMTFNTFASDLEKEKFLKEFSHKQELLEFYLTRGRVTDAFKFSVEMGDFEGALELVIKQGSEYGVGLKESEDDLQLKEVFKYAETKKLLSNISKSSAGGVDLACDQRFSGSSWSCAWADLVTVANGYFKDGIKTDRTMIRESWIREYMDTIISMKVEYFLGPVGYLDELPVEYLCGFAEMAKGVSQNKAPIPKSVLLCLGVLLIPGESNSYAVLTWSSLPMDSRSSRTLDYEGVAKKVIGHITKRLQIAGSLIEKKAQKLCENVSKLTRCDACLTRGKWDQPGEVEGPGSKCSHDVLSEIQFSRFIQGLARLCHSFSDLEVPSLGNWLDSLLSQMRYNSSFSQDAEEITATSQSLCTLAANNNVVKKLRGRFCNLWEPWATKNTKFDFTSLLESYQLGCNLGVEKGTLDLALNRRHLARQQPQKSHMNSRGWAQAPDFTFIAFNNYQILHSQVQKSPSQFSTGGFCENVCSLLKSLQTLRQHTKCLSFYHGSVISIYEDIVTFLLFSIRRTDVIVPKSWTKLYLPHWEMFLKTTTNIEQCCYQQTLLRVVASFCDLIIELERSPQGKPSEKELLARRSVDLLVIALVNMGTTGPLPLRYDEIWAKIQKVFGHKGLGTSSIQNVPANALVEPLTRAFKFYNGKDSILVYVSEGRKSRRVERLDGSGIRIEPLPIRRSFLGHFSVAEGEMNAAFIIQAWYRRKKTRFIRDKEHKSSPLGQAISSIYDFCSIHGAKMSRRAFLGFVSVMVTEGLEFYMLLDIILEKSEAIKTFMDNMRVPAAEKDRIEFLECQQQFSSQWCLFSIESPSALAAEEKECRRKCRKELEVAKSIREQMDTILQRLKKPPEGPKGKSKVEQKGPLKGGPKGALNLPKDGGGGGSKDTQKDVSKSAPRDGQVDGPKGGPKGVPVDGSEDGLKGDIKTSGPGKSDGGGNRSKGPKGEEEDKEKEENKGGKVAQENQAAENEMGADKSPSPLSEDKAGKGKKVDQGDISEPVLGKEGEGKGKEPAVDNKHAGEISGGPQKDRDANVAGNPGAASINKRTGGGGGKKKKKGKGKRR